MKAYIESIGLQAPGLESWQASKVILAGQESLEVKPLSKYAPNFLPANERRRTTPTIRLALRTAQDTLEAAPKKIAELKMPTLFACVDGDTEISAKMTAAILADEPMVSPIHFHNSVHNAPAGYWMIGQNNDCASSSISAGEYQVANTWLEAMTQLNEITGQIMLVMYDLPIDEIIESFQPEILPFGAGFILSRVASSRALAEVSLELINESSTIFTEPTYGLNAAAQIMPLLQGLARNEQISQSYPISSKLSAKITWKPCS